MKCIHCESEWNVSPGLSITVTVCPFCGKSLIPEKKSLDTVEDVLVEMNRQFGLSVLGDAAKLVAHFTDLAPHLARHRRILADFIECDGPKRIIALQSSAEAEQVICVKQIVKEMHDNLFVDMTAAQMICDAFLLAVTGKQSSNRSTTQCEDLASKRVEAQSQDHQLTSDEQYQKGEDSFKKRDYVQAVKWYSDAAKRGNVQGLYKLGLAYQKGMGITQDYTKAFSCFMDAANKGHTPSQFALACCYINGTGVHKDINQAIPWFMQSAKRADPRNRINEGLIYALALKHKISQVYLLFGGTSFSSTLSSAKLSYADIKKDETALLIWDNSNTWRAGKEGIVLTSSNLYYNSGFWGSKGAVSITEIQSVQVTYDTSNFFVVLRFKKGSATVASTDNANEAEKIKAFWNDVISNF